MNSLQYPIGKFTYDTHVTPEKRQACIRDFESLPRRLRDAVAGLTDQQLDTPYRDGGWTVRQLVHHLADSHMNGFIRSKLALVEESPVIKPYEQDDWVKTGDVSGLDVEPSLRLLDGLQVRWARFFEALAPAEFQRTFNHPELGLQTLDMQLQHYGWHGRHHVSHILSLRERNGWKAQ
ncbi:MAG TPA: putative metal-dependent hydrolase [Spirochaetia bacterium]|nr:putative metal-dependent hydrolase [Spirochaetia bacterium]